MSFSKSWSSCNKIFRSQTAPYSFSDIKYALGSGLVTYSFTGFDLNDCPFKNNIMYRRNGDESYSYVAETEKFLNRRAVLQEDPNDNRLVSVIQYPGLEIESDNVSDLGEYELQLMIKSQRYEGDNEQQLYDFKVTIIECRTFMEDSLDLIEMNYTLGEPSLELPSVIMTQIDEDCDSFLT